MKQTLKVILKIMSTLLCSILFLIIAVNIYFVFCKTILKQEFPTLFGFSKAVVVSGSMVPTLNVGDLIIVHKQESYEVDDIISYKDSIGVVTHRIVEKTLTGYITWGDNREVNNAPDDEIAFEDVYGKVVFTIPKIGYVVQFIKTTEGMISLALIVVAVVVISIVIEKMKKNKQATYKLKQTRETISDSIKKEDNCKKGTKKKQG